MKNYVKEKNLSVAEAPMAFANFPLLVKWKVVEGKATRKLVIVYWQYK